MSDIPIKQVPWNAVSGAAAMAGGKQERETTASIGSGASQEQPQLASGSQQQQPTLQQHIYCDPLSVASVPPSSSARSAGSGELQQQSHPESQPQPQPQIIAGGTLGRRRGSHRRSRMHSSGGGEHQQRKEPSPSGSASACSTATVPAPQRQMVTPMSGASYGVQGAQLSSTASSGGVASPTTTTTSFASTLHMMPFSEFTSLLLTNQANGKLNDYMVTIAMAHLSPEDYERVSRFWDSRRSIDDFVTQVVNFGNNASSELFLDSAKLGLEMSFAEFQRLVLDDIVSGDCDGGDPVQAIKTAMEKLGPESREVVEAAFYTRSSLPDFCRELSVMSRPRGNCVFSNPELTEITQSQLSAEQRLKIHPIENTQTVVTQRMRSVLVDWMVDVAIRFRCCQETLHLAAALVDRFLMVQRVAKNELQLLGVASMLLASKYEMVYPPELRDFIYIAACTYTKEDIIRMERQLFVSLEFNVTIPTVSALAEAILHQQDPTPTPKQLSVCRFLVDCTLVSQVFGLVKPSLLAATSVYLSRLWCGVAPAFSVPHDIWSTAPTLIAAVKELKNESTRFNAVKNKWSVPERHAVATESLPATVAALAPNLQPQFHQVQQQQQQQQQSSS